MPGSAIAEEKRTKLSKKSTKPATKRDKGGTSGRGATAEAMAARQRDISVSEFFAKNRHLLGFDNPRKALLTTVKEAVDNSLDACEEAGILPDITVVIEDLQPNRPATAKSSRYRVTIVDNGPGIIRKQVENIFGRLLYGSKFHRLKMSRGQQGIGISAAGMYGLITTGRPMVIHTRPNANRPAHHIELAMNTKTNRAEVTVDVETDDFPPQRLTTLTPGTRELAARGEFLSPEVYRTGTSVTVELEGRYQRGRGSVDEFLELTAIANPHARIVFVPPSRDSGAETDELDLLPVRGKRGGKDAAEAGAPAAGAPAPEVPVQTTETGGVTIFPRAVEELPPETKEIQPHPKGIELGILIQMLKEAELERPGCTLYNFLQEKFCRVSAATASALCEKIKVTSRTKVADIDHAKAEALYKAFQDTKFPPPPTDCLAPIGVRQLLAGMLKGVRAEFYAASSREAAIYRGRPFQIEAAIAFGGELPADDPARVIRFANRVPLLYQQSACSSFKAVVDTNWRNYDLNQPRGSAPVGPLVIMIHMASVWVPFTSESKEAIADYDEIRKEMKLALMECGRKLATYVRKRQRMKREGERRDVFERYIGEIVKAVTAINGADPARLYEQLLEQARARTAAADQVLDEEGRVVKDKKGREDASDDEGVIIVESARRDDEHKPRTELNDRAARVAAELASGAFGDDQLPILDGEPSRRSRKQTKKADAPAITVRARSGAKAASKKKAGRVGKPSKGASAPAAAAEPAIAPPKPKLRLRLVNGKLTRVDEPGLF